MVAYVEAPEAGSLRGSETFTALTDNRSSDVFARGTPSGDLSHQPDFRAYGALSDSEKPINYEHIHKRCVECWYTDGTTWARVHVQPRLKLFVPRVD